MDVINFENLPEGKKQVILSAGILCFGRSGYEKTSISEIANEAGISKAAIFYYFGTKHDLFLYLCRYVRNEVDSIFAEGTEDYFDSVALFLQAQFQMVKKHPGMYEFMRLVSECVETEGLDALALIRKEYHEKNEYTVLANVNWNKFNDNYDRATIANLTKWVGNGCLMDFDKTLSLDCIFAEVTRYLTIIKIALYKPEYL